MKLNRWHAVAAFLVVWGTLFALAVSSISNFYVQTVLGSLFGWSLVTVPAIAYMTRPVHSKVKR